MTVEGDWILLSEAAALGVPIDRVIAWLADDRLEARADEVVMWSQEPRWDNWTEHPPTGDLLRDAIINQAPPPDRYEHLKHEFCHVFINPEFWELHAEIVASPNVWSRNEIAIPGQGSDGRKTFYGIRVQQSALLHCAGTGANVTPASQCGVSPQRLAVSDTASTAPRPTTRARQRDIQDWLIATYTAATLPRVAGEGLRAAKAHFATMGKAITRERLQEAVTDLGWNRKQGRRQSPED